MKISACLKRQGRLNMWYVHHLVDLYKVRSNYAPCANNRSVWGSHVLHMLIKGKPEKNLIV